MKVTNVLQLLQEGTFIHIPLGTIHSCEQPALIHPNGDARSDRIRGEVGVGDQDHIRLPSQQYPSTRAIRRQEEKMVEGGAKAIPHNAVRDNRHLRLLNANHGCITR
jgi:hypothetical protein